LWYFQSPWKREYLYYRRGIGLYLIDNKRLQIKRCHFLSIECILSKKLFRVKREEQEQFSNRPLVCSQGLLEKMWELFGFGLDDAKGKLVCFASLCICTRHRLLSFLECCLSERFRGIEASSVAAGEHADNWSCPIKEFA